MYVQVFSLNFKQVIDLLYATSKMNRRANKKVKKPKFQVAGRSVLEISHQKAENPQKVLWHACNFHLASLGIFTTWFIPSREYILYLVHFVQVRVIINILLVFAYCHSSHKI